MYELSSMDVAGGIGPETVRKTRSFLIRDILCDDQCKQPQQPSMTDPSRDPVKGTQPSDAGQRSLGSILSGATSNADLATSTGQSRSVQCIADR